MAPSSKNSKRQTPKRTQSRQSGRSAPKKNTARNKQQKRKITAVGKGIALIAGMLALVTIGYCLGSCWHKRPAKPVPKKAVVPKTKKTVKQSENVKPKEIKPPTQHKVDKTVISTQGHKVKLAYRDKKPKLVIIIDDVHTEAQLNAITTLGFPVTPSIFPPYTLSPHTARLATHTVHYMIHLPMESGNEKLNRQSKTLKTNFSKTQIDARIHELRKLFPRAHYINNHTGSRFTENTRAMQLLYDALRKEGFVFIDSRTTAKTVVKKIAHRYGDAYVARDVFIDNIQNASAIRTQLKKAVALAKKKGYAIAIGHPHKATLEALRDAKPLLKEVEVVYIDDIFREE